MKFLRHLLGQSEKESVFGPDQMGPETLSDAQLLFLAKFLSSVSVSKLTVAQLALERWSATLGTTPTEAAKDLERRGLLIRPTAAQRMEGDLSLSRLKELCRSHDLKVTGKKADLSARLAELKSNDLERLVPLADRYVCSDAGRDLAESFIERRKAEKRDTQEKSADLLDAHDFEGAVKLVCDYEARQVFMRGMGVNWSSGTEGLPVVKSIYSARKAFLHSVSEGNLENIRLIAALDYLWGEEVIRGCPVLC